MTTIYATVVGGKASFEGGGGGGGGDIECDSGPGRLSSLVLLGVANVEEGVGLRQWF